VGGTRGKSLAVTLGSAAGSEALRQIVVRNGHNDFMPRTVQNLRGYGKLEDNFARICFAH
jgi:hypothetical protein